ncbi:sensor histidine kinase [Nocardiopsis alba]|uniref:sensor histidine kinase n=1 Tax=Nocardiopsis alba TaxID=53437 RepID=UPI003668850D
MAALLRRLTGPGLDPRGPRPHPVAHVAFVVTVFLSALVRVLDSLFIGVVVPPGLPYPDAFYVGMMLCVVPLCLLWPFTGWSPEAPARRRAATTFFLVLAIPVFPIMGFGGNALVAISVAMAACAFGVRGGLFQAALVGAVNALFGLSHPALPNGYALVNGAIMMGYGLCAVAAVVLLVRSAERARRTRELLSELEHAHELLRRHAARDRERAIDDERARMAREMHDSTGHHLSAVHLCLANAERALAELPDQVPHDLREELRTDVSQARGLTKEALADTRRWVRALKPLSLTERSGPEALRSLTESFGRLGVATSFTTTGVWPEGTDGEADLIAFRCVQEALTNVLRHSDADRAEVLVRALPDGLDITVSDDGRGPGDRVPGFGLTALRERIGALEGTLEVGPGEEGGFRLRARIPTAAHERRTEAAR